MVRSDRHIRHFIACEDCDLVMKIRPGTHQYCYKCNGHNISIFALKGTKEELDLVENKKYTTLLKERFKID